MSDTDDLMESPMPTNRTPRDYMRHTLDCAKTRAGHLGITKAMRTKCDCGLDAALAAYDAMVKRIQDLDSHHPNCDAVYHSCTCEYERKLEARSAEKGQGSKLSQGLAAESPVASGHRPRPMEGC